MHNFSKHNPLVYTVKNRCRVCYTCVRDCPAKAIKIINGQAEVITERCIACGSCVKVCSQGAKAFYESINPVEELLQSGEKVIACVAPSFPAEFTGIKDFRLFVGMVKKLGFDKVLEVSFGADVVANRYKEKLKTNTDELVISSDCPAIVNYIRHYYPDLVPNIAKIASPMVAINRVVKKKYGEETKTVFIGPCIAKKAESDEIDEVLTFIELRKMFEKHGIKQQNVNPIDFDPPFAGKGSLFPVSRGLLQNIDKLGEEIDNDILVTHGHVNFKDALEEVASGSIKLKYLEMLSCDGCIMGPGMSKSKKRFRRQSKITNYVKDKLENLDTEKWDKDIKKFESLDLNRKIEAKDRRLAKHEEKDIARVLESMGKKEADDFLNCGACGYSTCMEHAIAIIDGLAETEMCLPYTIEQLHNSFEKINHSKSKLNDARQALEHSEKLAGMGQLSAGIAHELNNPLGVITMYSNILKEEAAPDSAMHQDLELITEQAERCKKIVGGLLNFARKNQVRLTECNLEQLAKHSFDSVIRPDNIDLEFLSELQNPMVWIDRDQISQVLTNLEKNAVEAMPEGGKLTVRISEIEDNIQLVVSDTGTGISKENIDKIFTPFFTTKGIGKGTGLGLPLIYGIVKMHKGRINVKSNDKVEKGATGTEFIINIPRNGKAI
ncbi:MAG: [Fe-Fe] hydrogenase large subunit C-terminal domain-containing protein [Bacteroidota bacterium]